MNIKKCAHCGLEVKKLFVVSGHSYCSDCQLEAEVADQEQEEYDSLADDY
jgi:hypothetical protein